MVLPTNENGGEESESNECESEEHYCIINVPHEPQDPLREQINGQQQIYDSYYDDSEEVQTFDEKYPKSGVSHIPIGSPEDVRKFLQSSNQWPVVIKSRIILFYFRLHSGPGFCRLFIGIKSFKHGCDGLPAQRARYFFISSLVYAKKALAAERVPASCRHLESFRVLQAYRALSLSENRVPIDRIRTSMILSKYIYVCLSKFVSVCVCREAQYHCHGYQNQENL